LYVFREDTDLCWFGDREPIDNWEIMTLGEFHYAHMKLPTAPLYFDKVPNGTACLKGKKVCLKICIHKEGVSLTHILAISF